MSKVKTFLVHKNKKSLNEIKDFLEVLDNVEIVGTSTDVEDACKQISILEPSVVFTYFNMGKLNAFDMINKVQENSNGFSPSFRFISKDLNIPLSKGVYRKRGFDKDFTVKEFGKEGMVKFLNKFN